jgi:hypothetical protein
MDLIPTLPTYVTDVASQSVWDGLRDDSTARKVPEAYLRMVLTRIADQPVIASVSCCLGTLTLMESSDLRSLVRFRVLCDFNRYQSARWRVTVFRV